MEFLRNTAKALFNTAPTMNHYVLNTPLHVVPQGCQRAIFGLGCFWGAERKFWQQTGVVNTSVGYCGGNTEGPDYKSVCSGNTNHAEVVEIIFDPSKITYKELLHVFWSNHDPTQVNRQGNDRGTQYRTIIFYFSEEQKEQAEKTRNVFQTKLTQNGYGKIATEIEDGSKHTYYLAEEYHQQYLAKNPGGYCGLKGTGCYEPGEINGLLDF